MRLEMLGGSFFGDFRCGALWWFSRLHLLRGAVDRLADAEVGSATAKIAGHGVVDVCVCRFGVSREERGGGHDLARLAVSALRHLLGDPSALHHLEGVLPEAFDRSDLLACSARSGKLARAGGWPVNVACAGSAHADSATVFCAGHVEHVTQYP